VNRLSEADADRLISATPRLREVFDPEIHGGRSFIVSGRPKAWAKAARDVESCGGSVVAFHDIVNWYEGSSFEDKPVLRGRLDEKGTPVLFAGRPAKGFFNPCPPGPKRCVFHEAPIDWQRIGRHTPELWGERRDKMLAVMQMLADKPSQRTLASIVRARLEGDSGFHDISGFKEYAHPVVHAEPDDTVIDLGAFDGDVSKMFARQVGKKGRIYALEPDTKNFVALSKEAQRWENLVPLCVGGWSDDDVLKFDQGDGPSSKISKDGTTSIAVTAVDHLVKIHRIPKVDIIKFDVEGAEAEAIKGAAETIRTHRPKLMVSIYHKYDDIFTLPELLRPMLPRYRFYLGHHSYYQMETDLYAIPLEKWVRGRVSRRVKRTTGRVVNASRELLMTSLGRN